ncbi:MAG: outer membrane protein assembly factor BamD [Alphaproteobacteria bacterium]|nr:outer membrane protein assembly factor BamD [Alphaproteobacteria bacterium]
MSLTHLIAAPPARVLAAGLAALFLVFGLSACSSDSDKELEYVEQPVEELYAEALKQIDLKNWEEAAKRFDEVERQHPYSSWARRGMLMSAFCYYQANKYDQAILAAERFISLHPGNKDVSYAYYLRAISYYEQIVDVGRDQRTTELALSSLTEVARRFPDSEYARDARLKIDLTRDHLAGKEMAIGRYYLTRGQYVAAINRFRTVIEKYQTTTHTPEALHRLTEAYLAMGLAKEAQASAAVLGYNFPGSEWYQDSYALLAEQDLAPEEDQGSWMSRALSSVF